MSRNSSSISCQALTEMRHPLSVTTIKVDNQCAVGILTDIVKQRRAKAMDMRFFWVKNKIRQNKFLIYWRAGKGNRDDNFTKHYAPSYHKVIRSMYLLSAVSGNDITH